MNKNVLLLATVSVLGIIAVVGILFKDRLFCPYDDSNLCQFINTMPDSYSGEIISPQGTRALWKWDRGTQELVQMNQGKEVFHIVETQDAVFVKNIADDQWWKQSQEESRSYATQLMFDPEEYFTTLDNALESEETEVTPLGSERVESTSCRLYRITSDVQHDICIARGKLVMIQLSASMQSVVHETEAVIEEPQYGIVDAPRGKNTVLEAMESMSSSNTPSYVREFEQERIQAEKQGSNQGPVYVTPTSPPTQ